MSPCKNCGFAESNPLILACPRCGIAFGLPSFAAQQRSPKSALDVQEGGAHYKSKAIQPIEYIHANNLPFIEGSVVKYITRWRDKGGVEDLKKIKHYIDLLIELEAKHANR
jgi:hypothetical protein